MFTWICPKCGKEVPPSYSDCPNCSPSVAATPVEPPAAPAAPPPVAPPSPAMVPPAPVVHAHRPGHVSVPLWLLTIVFAAALIVIGLTIVVLRNNSRTAAAPASPASPSIALETPAAPPANAAFKNVELSGFRLTEDAKQKAFIQVIVVNHSAADLGELSAKVNLKAIAKQTQESVGTFPLTVTLGPYESKEVKAPLDTKLRVYELPDWQYLRAEIAQ